MVSVFCACVSQQGAYHVASAFRLKIRNEVLPYNASIDPKQFEEKVTLVREIADVLRKNVVQARKVDSAVAEDQERWGECSHDRLVTSYYRHHAELNFTEHTELGSNDTIKQAKSQSSRSARKQDGQVK